MTAPLAPAAYSAKFEEAKTAHLAGDFSRARHLYETLAAHNPQEPGPQALLAELDLRDGRLMTARARLEKVVAAHPESHEIRTALANILEELGDVNATTLLYGEDVTRSPDSPEAWTKLANALQVAGKIEDAEAAYRTIVERWPSMVAGYFGLVGIDAKSLSGEEVGALQRIASTGVLSDRVHALFALGAVMEQRGLFDEAFEAFSQGNRLRRENPNLYETGPAVRPTYPAGSPVFTSVEKAEQMHDSFVRETKQMFSAAYLAKFAGGGHETRAPIFIVGMPRSGSTLLEQILSSHPEVQGLGETSALSRTFRAGLSAMQHNAAPDPAPFYWRIGRDYLGALRELGWDGKRRVIDKMLGNYVNAGIAHLAMPDTVILHSVRDPVDTCLSSFRQLFSKRNEASYDLAAIGRQYVRYREMIAHWDAVLPGRIIHIEHEKLLADPEVQIRGVVKSCGLAWNDRCLRFYENERTVRTAS
ncbi:MAG: sulfotransferase, partial [Micropepsaceae bacterium]